MAKLHELLAVEADLFGTFKKIIEETIVTFSKRQEHFMGATRTLDLLAEGSEPQPTERKALDTTVNAKLDYQEKHIIRYLDAVLQKELTNQQAVADIVIDGVVVAEKIPAPYLLGLETKLKSIRQTYETIPTLPPGIEWIEDPNAGDGVYKRKHPLEQFKTEKVIVPQILYEATKEHPAQVKEISETKNIGKYTRSEQCSMLTPSTKSALLGRLDTLIQAVKKARQRANATTVVPGKIGEKLFNYINV
jgi:hypothetical protein